MHPNPTEEWQRLTKLYGDVTDGQLLELAETYSDLTEIAQPILRDEMKKRGLGEPQEVLQPPPDPCDKKVTFGRIAPRFSNSDSSDDTLEGDGHAEPLHEYTWKTDLCECATAEETWQVREVLRFAGIDMWVNRPSSLFGSQTIKILVAADQLDEARAVLARPIPQDIIDQSKAPVEDFVTPTCPKCGAPDPILDSIDPVNTWSCDVCGATWSDPATDNAASSEPVS
jgi:hypothetical protein